mmetsp:Transcript_27392/g.64225  ORF Transcript_27392/g.64225 Transcript_27392/m.64225 type:complete len:128 (-) Transcript_27392:632-1015(-)
MGPPVVDVPSAVLPQDAGFNEMIGDAVQQWDEVDAHLRQMQKDLASRRYKIRLEARAKWLKLKALGMRGILPGVDIDDALAKVMGWSGNSSEEELPQASEALLSVRGPSPALSFCCFYQSARLASYE